MIARFSLLWRRALFDWATIEEVSVTYKLGGTKAITELLIARKT